MTTILPQTITATATRSMSDDELMLMEDQARKLTVLELKKRAISAKQSGNVPEALMYLKSAKKIEQEQEQDDDDDDDDEQGGEKDDDDEQPPYASTLPIFWKKVAILCKQAGDLERAKQALMHSKELELELEVESKLELELEAEAVESEIEEEGLGIMNMIPEPPIPPPPPIPLPLPLPPMSNPEPEETTIKTGASTYDEEQDLPPPPSYENIDILPPPPSYDNLVSDDNERKATTATTLTTAMATTTTTNNEEEEEVVDEDEAAMLTELMGGGRESQQKSTTSESATIAATSATSAAITNDNDNDIAAAAAAAATTTSRMSFTDEELMDEEMMTEFRLGDVQGIPTQEEYASKVLTYKKLALKYKQEGDIPNATQNLRTAKQLEKVALALKNIPNKDESSSGYDPHGWMETLNPEESDLLGELLVPPPSSSSGNYNDNASGNGNIAHANGGAAASAMRSTTSTSTSTTDRLTVEDLEDMDDDNDVIELVEMMGGPNALPTVEELTAKIMEQKQNALMYKQEGNIELAKSSLLQSKKTKLQAMRLAEIYRKLETRKDQTTNGADDDDDDDDNENGNNSNNGQPVSMETLEALMNGGGGVKKMSKESAQQQPPPPQKDPWLFKPSIEIKAEVIRLKNDKQVKEATRLLQLFKQKVTQEQKQVELEKCSKITKTIQQRVDECETQRKLWQYYHWFGTESAIGHDQYQEWTKYETDCRRAMHLINTEGSDSVKIAPRGQAVGTSDATTSSTTNTNNNAVVNKKLYILEDDYLSLVESCTNGNAGAAGPGPGPGAVDVNDDATTNTTTNTTTNNNLADGALEVAIMGLFDMDKNEKLQKILSKQQPKISKKTAISYCPDLRINAKLQLPIYSDDPSKPVYMDFEPTNLSLSRRTSATSATGFSSSSLSSSPPLLQFKYDFDPTRKSSRQQIGLPRKDPKQERTLLRRMETKTIQLSIFYLHNQQKRQEAAAATAAKKEAAAALSKKKSWFFGRGGSSNEKPEPSEDNTGVGGGDAKDIFLGKVTIEFKQLLSRGCIGGDLPVMVNSKAIGGTLRVCLRTRPILDLDRYEGVPLVALDGEKSTSPSISSYKKGLAFTFKNSKDDDDDEKTSIEAIKRESALSQGDPQTTTTTTTEK